MKKALIVTAAVALAVATLPAADNKAPAAAPAVKSDKELFPDKVIAKGKGFEIKQSELEESFIAYRSSLAARGQNIRDNQRDVIEAQLLDRMILTKMLTARATER